MTNVPTSTEIRANTSRNVRTPLNEACAVSCASSMSWRPVTTSTSSLPTASATAARRRSGSTPGSASTDTWSTCPGPASSIWAVAASNSVIDAPAGLSLVPKRATPTTCAVVTPLAVCTPAMSPTR